MSSSGLDWEPMLHMWLKTRPHHEHGPFTELFRAHFLSTYVWAVQNLTLCMPILQVNVVSQVGAHDSLVGGLRAAICKFDIQGFFPVVLTVIAGHCYINAKF